ncbi:MAG: tetratricopeptide repeat protein [Planctomycetota bacterium]
MKPADWQRVRAAFERVVDLPPAERAPILDAALGDAPPLRAEVERLLAAEPQARDYLTPPGERTLGAVAPAGLLGPRPGDRIGPYELVRLLGIGGMGAVFEARQQLPQRTVALKVMRAGFGSERARRRFRDEIDLLAGLQHPGIAQVFEAGTAADPAGDAEVPWFAMELLDGAMPITDFARRHALPLAARLQLVRDTAAAIAHAHQRGVIHRDLKPQNILVDRTGRAKVIDFGIASSSAADAPQHWTGDGDGDGTHGDALVGTLAYMSPERLLHPARAADVRSDVYGLGVVLHELLAGARPFALDGVPLAAACRRITDEEPPLPSAQAPGLPRELDWIVQRALAKDPDRRYPSVDAFAEDLARFARHEPVRAAPPGAGYRLRKLLRRHRTVAAAAAVVVATTAGAFASVTASLWRAQAAETSEREGREAATLGAHRAEVARSFLLDVFELAAPGASKEGVELTMRQGLDRAAATYERRFADDPLARAELARTLGLAYQGLAEHATAERHLRAALELRRQHFAADTASLTTLHHDLADLLLASGRLDEAERELDAAARLPFAAPDARGERQQLVAATLRGHLLLLRGNRQDAVPALRAAIDALTLRYGEDDGDALQAWNVLGAALHEQGDLDGAEACYRKALRGLITRKGPEHPVTLTAMQNVAMLRFSRDRSDDESIARMQQVLAARRRVLGDDHPDTLGVLTNLGAQHFMRGDLDQARVLWDEAVARLGADDPDAPMRLALLGNIATIERDRENWPRAIELSREVLASRRRTLGPDHDKTLMSQGSLAEVLRQSDALDDARAEYAEVLQRAQQATPQDLPNSYRAQLGLGRIAREQRRWDEAEVAFRWCLDHFDAAVDACAVKSMLIRVEADLVVLYEQSGDADAAARFRAIVEDADYRERAGTDR